MQSRRFLALAVAAGMIGLGACDGAGEHNVPNENETGVGSNATLQDSAVAGQAVTTQGPVVAEEIKSPAPALPQGTANTPAAMDTTGGATAGGPATQPTLDASSGPATTPPAPRP